MALAARPKLERGRQCAPSPTAGAVPRWRTFWGSPLCRSFAVLPVARAQSNSSSVSSQPTARGQLLLPAALGFWNAAPRQNRLAWAASSLNSPRSHGNCALLGRSGSPARFLATTARLTRSAPASTCCAPAAVRSIFARSSTEDFDGFTGHPLKRNIRVRRNVATKAIERFAVGPTHVGKACLGNFPNALKLI